MPLTQTTQPVDYYLNGSPTGTFRTTLDRRNAVAADQAVPTTGVMHSTAIVLYAGDVIANLSFTSGATPANLPLNWWFALYDNQGTPALLSQSADQTTTAWAAGTTKTLALSAAQTITTTGVYYVSIMMKATTPVSLVGRSLISTTVAGAVVSGLAILARTSGSALTTTAPATITSATTTTSQAYVIAN